VRNRPPFICGKVFLELLIFANVLPLGPRSFRKNREIAGGRSRC
jgi:hypothetical protein